MTDADIDRLARWIQQQETRFSRTQVFTFYTRQLTETERDRVKEAVKARLRITR